MENDQHEDAEFYAIKPQQSAYELEHFDKRDQEFLTKLSILSQQCNLLRSRNFFRQRENDLLKQEVSLLRQELAPLQALHQKVTSFYGLLVLLGAMVLGLLELVKGIKGLFVK